MKKYLSIILSVVMLFTVVSSMTVVNAESDYFSCSDVATVENWQSGQYNWTTGAYEEDETRICLKKFIEIDTAKGYMFSTGNEDTSYRFLIREHGSDGNFIRSIGEWKDNSVAYIPSSDAKYISLSFYNSNSTTNNKVPVTTDMLGTTLNLSMTEIIIPKSYKWNLYSDSFKINSGATLNGGFDDTYKNQGTYFVSKDNVVGATATLTSLSTVEAGVYSVKLYARTTGYRADIDVSINDTKVASDLYTGQIPVFGGTGGYTLTDYGYDYGYSLSNIKIVNENQPITLTITVTRTTNIDNYNQRSGSLYLNSLELTKIADVEKDGTTTDALTLDSKASIRLGTVSGIRFYTAFDETQIEGTVVEKGTLIGPSDLVGDYLTFEDEEAGNAVAVPYLADTLWDNNEFVGSIVGIKDTNYNRAFVARAYVKLSDGTYLYSATTTTKTIAEIADAYIADDNANLKYSDLDTDTKALVDAWAAAND